MIQPLLPNKPRGVPRVDDRRVLNDGVPHLHVHLAPLSQGDALNSQIIRGELIEEKLPNGFTRVVSAQFPALPQEELVDVANRVGKRLACSMKVP